MREAVPDAATILLIRHAAHDRVDRVLCGRMPGVSLGETGRTQAARMAERLSPQGLSAIYASPLERARETAAPIAAAVGSSVREAPDWTEIDVGEWTGKRFDELGADPRWQAWNTARAAGEAPGGERMSAVQDRALAGLKALRDRHLGERVAVVSHADVIKAALCGVLGLSLDRYAAFDVDPASVSTIVLWNDGGKVLAINERFGA